MGYHYYEEWMINYLTSQTHCVPPLHIISELLSSKHPHEMRGEEIKKNEGRIHLASYILKMQKPFISPETSVLGRNPTTTTTRALISPRIFL